MSSTQAEIRPRSWGRSCQNRSMRAMRQAALLLDFISLRNSVFAVSFELKTCVCRLCVSLRNSMLINEAQYMFIKRLSTFLSVHKNTVPIAQLVEDLCSFCTVSALLVASTIYILFASSTLLRRRSRLNSDEMWHDCSGWGRFEKYWLSLTYWHGLSLKKIDLCCSHCRRNIYIWFTYVYVCDI